MRDACQKWNAEDEDARAKTRDDTPIGDSKARQEKLDKERVDRENNIGREKPTARYQTPAPKELKKALEALHAGSYQADSNAKQAKQEGKE